MGVRSPWVLYALVMPFLLTALIQGVFGDLFAPEPRLAIADEDASALSSQAKELQGIEVFFVDNEEAVVTMVTKNDVDAGMFLPAGFDDDVRDGLMPALDFYVSGESLASNRIILGVTTLDMLRGIEGTEPPVEVVVNQLGEALDFSLRMLPLLLLLVVAVAAAFVPASGLVQEKEDRTLSALLVSPASITDVISAKAALGVLLAVVTGFVTLWINEAVTGNALTHLVILVVAALMMAEIGVMLGLWAKDSNTMFTAWKGGAIVLFFPAIFYMFPDLPQWIARLGPTYYFMDPSFRVTTEGATLGDVWANLIIGVAIVAALFPVVLAVARRAERNLAAS